MKDFHTEPSFEYLVTSWSDQTGDCFSELEAEMISPSPEFVLDDKQKTTSRDDSVWERSSPAYSTEQIQAEKPSYPQSSQSDQCCAFRKLGELLGNTTDNKKDYSRNGPRHRLITWITLCRDQDPALSHVKRFCPLARCPYSCDPENGDLIRHVLDCSFLKYGIYNCPYCNKVETFATSYEVKPRRRWNRNHSLRDIFRDVCKLGTKGINKAKSFGHPNKRQRDTQDDHSTHNETVGFDSDDSIPTARKRPTSDHFTWSEAHSSPVKRSEVSHSRIQSQIREADDSNGISELASNAYCELPSGKISDEQHFSELSASRFSSVLQDLPKLITGIEHLDTDTFKPSPISTTQYVSSERFESPISPQEVQRVNQWTDVMENSSGQHVSLDAVFAWPMNKEQTVQPTLSVSATWEQRRRARTPQKLCIDTSVGGARPVAPPNPKSPATCYEDLPSTSDNPEVLSYEPIRLFEELRSTLKNTYTVKYAQLTKPPRSPINQAIIDMQASPATVLSSGWEAVEMVLKDQLPQTLWWLFSLAQLAFACGQVVWEGKLKYQIDEIVDDLKVWSHALRCPLERQYYQDVIEQIFANTERKSSGFHEAHYTVSDSLFPASSSSTSYRDTLSLDHRELVAKLKDGAVVRMCLQFLCSFEFLQNRVLRANNGSINGFSNLSYTAHSNSSHVAFLDSAVIQELLAKEQFLDFGEVIEKGADLLSQYPNTTSRELEVFLVCHARYYAQDHALHLQFRRTVAKLCIEASYHLTGTVIEPAHYLLEDIAAVRQCQKDLASTANSNQNQAFYSNTIINTSTVQELQGSPVAFSTQQFTYTSRDRSSCVYPRSRPGRRNLYNRNQIPTSAHSSSPSTTTSSQAPIIWTPISANSNNSATPAESNFSSPVNSMYWPVSIAEEAEYMHPNFPLPADNDYSFLTLPDDLMSPDLFSPDVLTSDILSASEIIPTDISLFDTNVPTTTDLPAGPESKASLSCPECAQLFTGKEQFLASNLRRHMRELHSSAAKSLTCEKCQKAFSRKHNLKVHMDNVHAKGRS